MGNLPPQLADPDLPADVRGPADFEGWTGRPRTEPFAFVVAWHLTVDDGDRQLRLLRQVESVISAAHGDRPCRHVPPCGLVGLEETA